MSDITRCKVTARPYRYCSFSAAVSDQVRSVDKWQSLRGELTSISSEESDFHASFLTLMMQFCSMNNTFTFSFNNTENERASVECSCKQRKVALTFCVNHQNQLCVTLKKKCPSSWKSSIVYWFAVFFSVYTTRLPLFDQWNHVRAESSCARTK